MMKIYIEHIDIIMITKFDFVFSNDDKYADSNNIIENSLAIKNLKFNINLKTIPDNIDINFYIKINNLFAIPFESNTDKKLTFKLNQLFINNVTNGYSNIYISLNLNN